MNAGEESISEESQATMLLESVLRPQTGFAKDTFSIHEPCTRARAQGISSSASLRSAAPQYRFQGLATTQTESQSENVSQGAPGLDGHPAFDEIPPVLEQEKRQEANRAAVGSVEAGHSARRSARLGSTKTLPSRMSRSPGASDLKSSRSPFVSPGPSNRHPKPPSRYAPQLRRQRSLSPVSQDSFAGPLPLEDQEKLYIRTARAFHVPLNQLSQSQESVDDRKDINSSPDSPLATEHSLTTEPMPSGQLESQGYGLTDDSIYGDLSLAQGQGANAFYDVILSVPSPTSSPESSAPSSSYYRLMDGDYGNSKKDSQELLETQLYEETQPVATQITPIQETQPTTDLHTVPDSETTPSAQPGTSVATGSTMARRGLLALVDSRKKWRIQNYEQMQRATASTTNTQLDTQLDTTGATYGDTVWQDTQPSEDPPMPPLRRREEVATEEIPDSEPPQPEAYHDSPRLPIGVSGIQGRFRALSVSTVSEEESTIPGLVVPAVIPVEVPQKQEVEESSDDEGDDIPLAAVVKANPASKVEKTPAPGSRGEGPPAEMPPPKSAPRGPPQSAAATRVRRRPNSAAEQDPKNLANKSWENAVIPSSEPQENATRSSLKAPPSSNAAKTSIKPSSRPISMRSFADSTSTLNPVTPVSNPHYVSRAGSEAETVIGGPVMRPPSDSVDQATELADDDPMDVDYESEVQTRSRKRKRTASVKVKREPKSTVKRGNVSPTPSRPPKRQKSGSVALTPTRVFALWKDDNCYYSAVVHELSKGSIGRFLVKFDDGDKDYLDVRKLRLCQLQEGDHVLFDHGERGTIVEVSGDAPNDTVLVEVDDGAALIRQKMRVRDVRIAGRTLQSEWKDRMLQPDEIITAVRPRAVKPSPAQSRMSLASAGSSKSIRSRILGKTGFVITMSPGNSDWDSEKKTIMASVKTSGGHVFDDWGQVFKMEGRSSQGGKRWIIEEGDVTFMKPELDRVFLLSDQCNRKPKFLIALALGIPCLSLDWLEACIREKNDVDWHPYLLPAGMSETLDARVSQFVDLDWGSSHSHLHDIMADKVPAKLFRKKNIVCLSPDFVPNITKGGTSDADRAKEATGLVPKIILCMGASRVEAVPDGKYASQSLKQFDYVIVKEEGEVAPLRLKGVPCVHFGWVKECLVAGRLLDFEWD
ncbi:unnamed protein product [Somion occarium]|uniref:BRCT domain-containing protein n=1 Tax=Somion occarium TaxID=3059160 RepID=A0ABP1D9U0_9APHY